MHFVVTSVVRRLVRSFPGLATFLLLPAAFAAGYTVTAASPENIDFAGADLQPGDTIRLEAQTRAKLVLENLTQGTAEHPIVITNVGGQFVIDNPTGDKGLHFYNCRNIVVRGTPSPGHYDYGIRIARVSAAGGIGVAFSRGSTDFAVTNVEIAHTGFAGLMAKSDSLKGSSGFVMRHVRIHGLYIHDVGAEGIYVGSSFHHVTDPASPHYDPHEVHDIEIDHNLITHAGWDGIQLGCATRGANSIHHNRIVGYGERTGTNTAQDEGIRSNPGTAADIHDNWIEGDPANSGTGIFANPSNTVRYCNNVIITPQEWGIFVAATPTAKSHVAGYAVKVFNNTIVSPAAHGVYLKDLGRSSGNRVQNNLIVAPGGESVRLENTAGTASPNLTCATAAAAVFLNPAAGDYRLAAGSPAVDMAADLTGEGITADFAGNPRPGGTAFDFGAHERPVEVAVGAPRQTAARATVPGRFDFNYLRYLPPDYEQDPDRRWPLLVFLHGYGERSLKEAQPMDPVHLNRLKRYGPPRRIEEGAEFPFIVVSPQCAGDWWSGEQLEQFILELVRQYRVDAARIYLTGLSMGGMGVYDLAQRQPARYAAIAPVSAAPQVDAANSAAAPALCDLPLWAFHGANDTVYSVAALQGYLDLIRRAGGQPRVTVYSTPPGDRHDSWVRAYADDELYAWLLTHQARQPGH